MTYLNGILWKIFLLAITAIVYWMAKTLIPAVEQYLKEKIREMNNAAFEQMVEKAVYAAEQTIKGVGKGGVKKTNVELAIKEYLQTHNVDFTEKQIDDIIEAAVMGMNEAKKEKEEVKRE